MLKFCLIIGVMAQGLAQAEGAAADSEFPTLLRPYKVEYLTKDWSMKVKTTRELKQGNDGVWDLREGGSALMQRVYQHGRFRAEGERIIPLGFTFSLSGAVKRKREVQFPEDGSPVRSLYKDKWYEFPSEPGMLDRLTMTEQFRLLLMRDPPREQSLVVKRVDGRNVKEFEMNFVAEESLQTALGRIQTVRFQGLLKEGEKAFDIWLAPQWDYLMVRTVHMDEGKEVEAVITGGSIDGTPLDTID